MEGREKWKSLNYENLEEKKKAMEIWKKVKSGKKIKKIATKKFKKDKTLDMKGKNWRKR